MRDEKRVEKKEEKGLNAQIFPTIVDIRVVGNYCNMKCRYCVYYDRNQDERTIMDLKVFEKFTREFLNLPSKAFTFIFYGGEPLLAGIDFFEAAMEIQEKHRKKGQKIINCVQTNGTLINEKWAEFFKKYNFRVGVSLDGTKEIHDKFRVFKNGQGSFDYVIQGLQVLQNWKVEFGIMQTITKETLEKALEVFRFFTEELRIKNWAFQPYWDFREKKRPFYGVNNEEFIKIFKTYFRHWIEKDDFNFRIREIDDLVGAVLIPPVLKTCDFGGRCGKNVCLDYDGKLYLCSHGAGEQTLLIGDILKQNLREIFEGKKWKKLLQQISTLSNECKGCKWKTVCGNGCVLQRKNGKYYYCPTRKKLLNYVSKIVDLD